MALITCPECQNQMSDTAPACPRCGWARAVAAGYPPPGYGQGAVPRRGGIPGWVIAILAVLGVSVVLGGVLVVLAISGTRKFIAAAKTAEARNTLGEIARDAATTFEAESLGSAGSVAPPVHRLCASASRPVPASVSSIRGRKYQSTTAEWTADATANAGFACLQFSMVLPQYFQYSYTATATGKPGDKFVTRAVGDLNGDGVTSAFELRGAVGANDALDIDPQISEDKPQE